MIAHFLLLTFAMAAGLNAFAVNSDCRPRVDQLRDVQAVEAFFGCQPQAVGSSVVVDRSWHSSPTGTGAILDLERIDNPNANTQADRLGAMLFKLSKPTAYIHGKLDGNAKPPTAAEKRPDSAS